MGRLQEDHTTHYQHPHLEKTQVSAKHVKLMETEMNLKQKVNSSENISNSKLIKM